MLIILMGGCGQQSGPLSQSGNALSQQSSCGTKNDFFTVSPIAQSDLTNIVPLGNPNPPAHIFPTDHIYFYLRRSGPPPQSGALAPAAEVPVVAPGNMTLVRVNSKQYLSSTRQGFQPHTDYEIEFSLCSEFTARFDHLASLSDKIKSQSPPSDSCQTYDTGAEVIKSCVQNVNINLNAGDSLGTAGGPNGSNALDFGAIDTRIPSPVYANPSRWGPNTLSAVCALDYYTSDQQSVLKAKLGSFQGNLRTIPPLCGTVAQDVPNTAQGVWFVKGTMQTYPEAPHLALVHDNIDPSKGVFSVGSSMSASGLSAVAYNFVPTTSGSVNTDFKNIGTDGKTYCFETSSQFSPGTFVIILQLTTSNTLRMEKQTLTKCGSGPWTFGSTYTDFER